MFPKCVDNLFELFHLKSFSVKGVIYVSSETQGYLLLPLMVYGSEIVMYVYLLPKDKLKRQSINSFHESHFNIDHYARLF